MTIKEFAERIIVILPDTLSTHVYERIRYEAEICSNNETSNFQSTTLTRYEDECAGYDITACCSIGPIVSENYCPKCGKKIIKTNPHSEGIGEKK